MVTKPQQTMPRMFQVKPTGNTFVLLDEKYANNIRDEDNEYYLTVRPKIKQEPENEKLTAEYFVKQRANLKWTTDHLSDKELIHLAHEKYA